MQDYSYVFNAHPEFIDSMYAKYLADPTSVEPGWRTFFEGFEFGGMNGHTKPAAVAGVSSKIGLFACKGIINTNVKNTDKRYLIDDYYLSI